MKRIASLFLLLWIVGPANAQDAPILLSLHGSNTVGQRLAPALALAWAKSEGWEVTSDESPVANERLILLRRDSESATIAIAAHGTSTGLSALVEGRADLWMASRAVLPEEVRVHARKLGRLDEPSQEHVIALDGLAIIVPPGSRLSALTLEQLRSIFLGSVTNWSKLGLPAGEIRVHARDDKSGTFDTFKSLVLQGGALDKGALRFESTEALAAAVAATPNAIGFVGLAGVGKARAIAVSDRETRPMLPAALSIATEDYVLSRRLLLYSTDAPREEVKRFVEFAQSADGQTMVSKVGFVGQGMSLHATGSAANVPEQYRELTAGALRLSVNLRFGNARSYLDSKAMRDLERIAMFLRPYQRGEQEIILIGFSDRREHNPILAQHMSNDRADYVATELAQRGVQVHRSRGLGQDLAVAGNDSEPGRSKNRRVEIWVRPKGSANPAVARKPSPKEEIGSGS
ncbi:MAG: phosphate ABC transporter substrate-binding/OmpA family protein [Pseudomonadota bacterium]|nr:phosphate ABC transporter substrate-binding/OmpA family protein [Pseudomonadota bacterium]